MDTPTVPNRLGSRSLPPLLLVRYRTAVTLVLALMALVGYTLYTVQSIKTRGLFDYAGVDFRTYYASGQLFRDDGPRAMYDLSLHEVYQKVLYDRFAIYVEGWSTPFYVLPTPYLPVFMLPFVGLSFLPPFTAFLVWEGANALITLGYLWLWTKRLGLRGRMRLMLITVIFLGVQNFYNLFFSQTNLILMVAVGEALYHLMQGREGRAGLWLVLGLIKPQAILLLALILLLLRGWRFRAGLVGGTLIIGGASWVMLGWQGMRDYIAILSSYTPLLRIGGITWMSLVDNLTLLGLQRPMAFVIGAGMALVVLMSWAYILWQIRRFPSAEPAWDEVFLLTSAAQAIVAPHGHVHMALMLGVPWLVYVNRHHDTITWLAFLTWGIGLGLIFLAVAQKSLGNAVFILGMFTLMMHVFILLLVYENWKVQTQR